MKNQYFSYDPNDGIKFHNSLKEARARAETALDEAEENAADSDWTWSENEDEICYGEVFGRVVVNDRELTEEEKKENPDWHFIRSHYFEEKD